MRSDVRDSGIDIIGNVPWGTHFCQFYQTKEDLMDVLVPYFKAGLENNEFCMWVTSEPLNQEQAKEALKGAIPDFDIYLEKGQIEIIPYDHWYVKDGVFSSERVLNGWVEKLNQALVNGYDGLRLTGNTFWLEKKNWKDFVGYEEEVDSVLGNYNMIALCTYCLDRCNATEIIDVVINHQFALIKKEGKWEQIESSRRKQAEEILLQKREELNEAQRIAHIGSWYWDAKTDANTVSEELLRTFGQDFPPFQKQKGIIYPYESWERLNAAVQKAVETGTGYELDLEAFHGYGHAIWITIRGEVVRDTRGEVIGLRGTVQDITSRKRTEEALHEAYENLQVQSEELQAQSEEIQMQNEELLTQAEELRETNEALRESEERFELLSNANALLLSSKDPESIIQIIAEKVMHYLKCDVFFNYVFKEVQDRLHLNAYGGISAEAAKKIEWLDKGVAICGCVARNGCRIVSEGVQHNGDKRADLVRSMGIQAYVCQPLRIEEKIIGTLSFGTRGRKSFTEDELALISTVADQVSVAIERKRAEEALQRERSLLESVMETTDFMLAFFDPQFNFIWVNSAYAKSCQMKPEELVGKNHFALYPHVENEAIFQTVRDTGKGVFYKDKPFVYPDQPERGVTYWDWNLAPVRNSSKHVTGLVLSLRETTRYKQAEEALRESESIHKVAEAVEAERQRLFDMLEALPVMICLLTPDYHVAFANRTFRERFGKSEGRHCYEYCYGLSKPCDFCKSYKVLETGRPHHWEINTPDGSIHDAYSFPFTDVDGSPLILEMDIDITERRRNEEFLAKIEISRKQEIHHRIKNNLQVISSLLDLQAEKFNKKEYIKDSEVLDAFRESQDRVISMALIHEELYKGGEFEALNFSSYIEELAENLFQTYRLGNTAVSLKLDLVENIFFDMDTAVPLGIIVNELISNSLKHAFPEKNEGTILIKLHRDENCTKSINENVKSASFALTVSDNGMGIPESLDIEGVDTLGMQLVTSLVDQLDGNFEFKRNNGTEFTMRFTVIEKNNRASTPVPQLI